MEALAILEKKIEELVQLISQLRLEKAELAQENIALQKKIEDLEVMTLEGKKESDKERDLAREMVDSLIKDIDAVVEQEH